MPTPVQYASEDNKPRSYGRALLLVALIPAAITLFFWTMRWIDQLSYLRLQYRTEQLIASPDACIWSRMSPPAPVKVSLLPECSSWQTSFVFVHGLRTPHGLTRLVVINVADFGDATADVICTVYAEAGFAIGSQIKKLSRSFSGPNLSLSGIIYAGQPDPTDESHLTIRYELNGKSDLIDGWLMPDDTVKLQPRSALK